MENFKETINRLSMTEYKIRGSGLKTIVEYLQKKKGEEIIPEIEERLFQYGYSVKLREIRSLEWYQAAFVAALLFSISEVLNWSEEEMKDMGRNEPKTAFLIRYLAKYIISLKQLYQAAAVFWKKTYNFGQIEAPELNKEEKYAIIKIKDFNLHPFFCRYLEGYMETLSGFVLRKYKKIWCYERKCFFDGDLFHEFVIHWE